MNSTRLFGSFAAALLVAAPIMAYAETPAAYVAKAGAGDVYETKSSKLVLATTHDPKIKSFASMMLTDHAKSTAMVKQAAMKSGLSPKPPMMDADQHKMIAELLASKGTARDTLYVSQQKMVHAKALELHSGYAETGTAAPLKAAAAKIAPVVQHHIDMLAAM